MRLTSVASYSNINTMKGKCQPICGSERIADKVATLV
jgi:hypothetical protein